MYVLYITKLALILTMGVFSRNNDDDDDETSMYLKVSEYWQKFIFNSQYIVYVDASHFFCFFLREKRHLAAMSIVKPDQMPTKAERKTFHALAVVDTKLQV